jgi:hypothetical protein
MSYGIQPASTRRIENPTGLGLSEYTDLRMYRLLSDPGLPSLSISSGTPTVSTEVVMIGNGRDRSVDQSHWDVAVDPGGPDVWTVAADPLLADVSGWATTGTRAIRWGDNRVGGTATVDLGDIHGEVLSFFTAFDEVGGTTHEAQGVNGDSSGGVFFLEGGDWVLGGIMNAVGSLGSFPYDGRPPGEVSSNPYPYFGRVTTAADLSEYRSQIEAIVATPEPSTALLSFVAGGLFLRRRRS